MKLSVEGQLRRAVWGAFAVGAVFNSGAALAQDSSNSKDATQLQGVEVTGSRIRRVDTETSNPVEVLDRKQINATGASTVGELLQSIPAFGGTPTNAQTNNGGGSSAAFIDLRGLGPQRTLILIDGNRVNDVDVNSIPSNLIERVEVLKVGAGAVYGTDAIGGVVNFITRKSFTGLEVQLTGGETQKGDGENGDVQLTWGSKVAGGNVLFGATFNRQDEIKAGDRATSRQPAGFYYGAVLPLAFSSSRGPQGNFNVGAPIAGALPTDPRCPVGSSGTSVTLIPGRTGTSVNDYRRFCSNFGAGFSDRYNFQPENFALDPSKRVSLFGSANLPVSENIKWFANGYFTQTRSNNQLAAEPFDQTTIAGTYPISQFGPAVISAQNIYNPFGRNITTFAKRSTDVGDRQNRFITDDYQFVTGLKGTVLDRFNWDLSINYGRQDQENSNFGFLDFSKIFQQIGPSFIDGTGTARCGTAAAPIPLCTPINVFGTTGNTLKSLGTTTNFLTRDDEIDTALNISGELFNLPAGAVTAAVGGEYRTLHFNNTPDQLAQEFALSEANSQATDGSYNVREAYTEGHIPILAGLPGVKSLDVNAGVRYSNYSSFGSNVSGKYALEYRPYSDLLLRGTYADVFRAPQTTDLFAGAAQGSPGYQDPCNGATAAVIAAHPTACQNVAPGFQQANAQGNAIFLGNPGLKPEKGYSVDFGAVFSPSFYKPLSIEVDYFRYSIRKAISTIGLNDAINECFNDGTSSFCGNNPVTGTPYVTRDGAGQIANYTAPTSNSTAFDTRGIDYAIRLNYPKVAVGGIDFGKFAISGEASYLIAYQFREFDPGTGVEFNNVSIAGQFDGQSTGNSEPRTRFYGNVFWSKGPFAVAVQDRFIGDQRENTVNTAATATDPVHHRAVGSANYVDLNATYTVARLYTDFTVGVRDLGNEGAQQQYDGNVLAGASNPLYPIEGRSFYGRVTLHLK